jgi:hypothetical protein
VSLRDLQLELRATNSAGEQEGYTVDVTDLAPGATYENELYLSFGCDIPADTADYTVNVTTSTPLTSESRTTAVGSIRYPRSDTCVFELNTPYNQSCFIATAAYGSPLHPHVDALRAFRDRVLLEAPGGRQLVAFYYAHSPPVARAIAGNDGLRWLARLLLTPLIYAIVYPVQVAGLVCLVLLGWMARRRRSRL